MIHKNTCPSSLQFRVAASEHGTKLFPFLKKKCAPFASGKKVKKAIDSKQCTVNGHVHYFSSYLLSRSDVVEIDLSFPEKKKTIDILYEDEWLLICNKPAGVESSQKSFPKWELVHRLDKETSGALILAKTAAAKKGMESLFAERKVKKVYLAVVDGVVEKKEGTIDNYLEKKESRGGQSTFREAAARRGVRATTYWKCRKKGKTASLLVCSPLTGRTHQIRVHMSGMGHPILGDYQYGKKFICPLKPARHLLHAYAVAFEHPISHEKLDIKAPLPEDFTYACQTLF